ncbi:hypothetical protein GCM10007901_23790 [Dyella acidisoli]|uniref:Uncharacterized protein n=1 Tax=Dyella acidisoli TaxID=1867834 RepID=A0ABQ5XQW0_9GAMM|nr:hypothetical protein GCM10007901_23790 [Dyella acidisoli]
MGVLALSADKVRGLEARIGSQHYSVCASSHIAKRSHRKCGRFFRCNSNAEWIAYMAWYP